MTSSVPPGHWREAELLAEEGFPARAKGEPYAVVVHRPSGSAFFLDGVYELLSPNEEDVDEILRKARLHHADSWEGWLPTKPEQVPWWASRLNKEEFTAYWVAE